MLDFEQSMHAPTIFFKYGSKRIILKVKVQQSHSDQLQSASVPQYRENSKMKIFVGGGLNLALCCIHERLFYLALFWHSQRQSGCVVGSPSGSHNFTVARVRIQLSQKHLHKFNTGPQLGLHQNATHPQWHFIIPF